MSGALGAVVVREPSAKYLVRPEPASIHGFELLTTAPGGVAELRALIHSLAIRGLLVSHDSGDQPASALIVDIRVVKDRLVADGKLRPDKPSEQVCADDQPFAVPASWAWARFGSVSINRDGERIPVSSEDRQPRAKLFDYYGASGVIDKIDGFLFDQTLLLIGEDGANLINRATPIAFLASGKFWVNNHAHVIDATHPELMQYLCLFINAISLEPYITGTAQPKMNQAKLNSIPVALPPLAEQHRIVARVEELMRLCDALERGGRLADEQHARLTSTLFDALAASESAHALAENWQRIAEHFDLLLDRPETIAALEQTILQLAVRGMLVAQAAGNGSANEALMAIAKRKEQLIARGSMKRARPSVPVVDTEEPFAVPLGWAWVRLADLCSLVTDGEHATPQRCDDVTAIPLVTAKNVRSEVMDYAVTDFVPRDVAAKCWLRCKPELGDILMVSVGATLGRLCVLRDALDMVLVRSVTLLRPVHAGVCVDYLALHLMSSGSQREIWSEVKQSAQPGLYLAKSAGLKIALPPLAEQHRIVARVEELRHLCTQLRERLSDARRTQSQLADALVAEVLA